MENTRFKRLTSLLLAVTMVFILIPFGAIPLTAASLDPGSDEADIFGYGFDITGGKELEKQSLKKNPILDISSDELFKHVFVSNYNKSYSKSFVTDTALEMSEYVSTELGIGLNAKVGGSLFNIDGEFDTSVKSQIASAVKERYEYYYNQIEKKSMVLQLSLAQIKDYLSVEFKRDMLAVQDEDDANTLFDKYGTHLITGYVLGGRMEITNYRITSDASKDWSSVNSLKATIGATISVVSGGGTVNFAEQHGSHETSSTSKSTYQATQLGGLAVAGLSVDSLFTYNDSIIGTGKYEYARWIDSVNEGTNLDIVGIDQDGGAIPLWDLLPNDSKYSDLRQTMLSAYIERCDGKYTEYLEKYPALVTDLSDKQEQESLSGQIQIDGYYQSVPTAAGNATNEIVFSEGQTTANVVPGATLFMASSNCTIMDGEKSWSVTGTGADYVTILDPINGVFKISEDAPISTSFKIRVNDGDDLAQGNSQITFTVVKKLFSGGDGTANSPYVIARVEDLQYLRDNPTYWAEGVNFVLISDIDYASNANALVKPIGTDANPFKATFDGNYHTIKNCGANTSLLSTVALFGKVGTKGVIKNLNIESSTISVGGDTNELKEEANKYLFVGALVGVNQGTIENCIVKNPTITAYKKYNSNQGSSEACIFVGGLAGDNSGTIKNCGVEYPTIKSNIDFDNSGAGNVFSGIGGLIGHSSGVVTNCYVRHNENTSLEAKVYGDKNDGWGGGDQTGGYNGLGGLIGHTGGVSELENDGYITRGANSISGCVVDLPTSNKMNLRYDQFNGNIGSGTLIGTYNNDNKPAVSNCLTKIKPTIDTNEYYDIKNGVGQGSYDLTGKCNYRNQITFEEVRNNLTNYDGIWTNDSDGYPILKSTILKSLVITDNKTNFYYDEEFNLVGTKVSILNGNDETQPLTVFVYSTTDYDKKSIESYTAKIDACGLTKTYLVQMNKCEIVNFTVNDISENMVFAKEKYDPTQRNIEIILILNNGYKVKLDLLNTVNYINYPKTAPTYSSSDKLSLGDNEIKVTYNGITKSFFVVAEEKLVEKLEITKQPKPREYYVGQAFSTSGMEVTATYQDGTTAKVPNSDLEIIGETISFGTNVVSLSYKDYTNIETVTIECNAGLFVRELPTKTSFYIGEVIDFSGLVLEFTTNGTDFTPVSIEDCEFSQTKITKDDANVIKIYYQQSEATITLNGIGYTITFLDMNDNVLSEKIYLPGEEVIVPVVSNNVAGYTFIGWDKPIAPYANAGAQYRAVYKSNEVVEGEKLLIKFVSWDGTVISEINYSKGDQIAIPAAPSREGYTFIGWDKTITNAYESKTYTAVYSSNVTEYTIRFVDYDDRLISETTYPAGSAVSVPSSPVREGYTFTGWDKPVTNANANVTYKAQYVQNVTKYTIKFLGYNGVILSQSPYEEGATVTVPTPPNVDGYTFVRWDKEITPATGDTTYTAIYEKNIKKYTVFFYGFNNTLLSQKEYNEGSSVIVPEAPIIEGYTFKGWDKEITPATANTVYTAKYEKNAVNKYLIKFIGFGGVLIGQAEYEEGATVTVPTPPNVEGYTFKGWDKEITSATDNITYTAQYDKIQIDVPVKYLVQFYGHNNVLIGQGQYEIGEIVNVPSPPNVDGYTFKGWDKEITTVTGNETYTAIYEKNVVVSKYVVKFFGFNNVLLSQAEYEDGALVNIPTVPNVNGYTFTGWDKEITTVTENAVYTAIYEKNAPTEYLITFLGHQNALISQEKYELGATVNVPSAPIVDGYTFKGWDKTVTTVTGDTTYTAIYEKNEVTTKYLVQFYGHNSVLLSQGQYELGEIVTVPTPPNVDGYTFKGWDKEITTVAGNETYTAIYEKNVVVSKYVVKFFGFNNVLLSQAEYEMGAIVTVPTPPNVDGYTFKSWDKEINNVTGNTSYYAIYEKNKPSSDTPNPPVDDSTLAVADVNGDGSVTMDDVSYLIRHIHFPLTFGIKATGDLNGDGRVTTADAIYLKNYLNDPSSYPIG